jgi:glutathione S-transferase
MNLYGYRNGRTLRALWTLEEVGADYEYVEVDIIRGEARRDWFLHLNPAAKVPVLVDDTTVITESAAVCLHLAEKYPEAGLLPGAGTPERTRCYQWISFILTELDAPLWTIAKHRFALPKERRVADVIDTAVWEVETAAELLARGLGESDYLVNGAFTLADILAGHTLLWAASARIGFEHPRLERYLQALLARDALARAQHRAASSASRGAE